MGVTSFASVLHYVDKSKMKKKKYAKEAIKYKSMKKNLKKKRPFIFNQFEDSFFFLLLNIQ